MGEKSENNKKSRKKAYNFLKLTYFHRRNIWRPLEWYKSCFAGRNNTMFEDYRYVSFHNNSPKIASQDQFLLQKLQQAKKGGKNSISSVPTKLSSNNSNWCLPWNSICTP